MIAVTPNAPVIQPTFTQQFSASGGVEPYTWSVAPGGLGGTIDSNGLYTSPDDSGIDTIIATDFNGDEGDTFIAVEPLLGLLPALTMIGRNTITPLAATGGVPPYAYAKTSGPGYIDRDTGLFHSEDATGAALITVTDSLGATATARVRVGNVYQIICEIIQREMGLDESRVWLWDQKINEPTDADIFIVLRAGPGKCFGNNTNQEPDGTGLNESQSVNMHATLQIDIKSRSIEALERREEVLMALKSTYSVQQQSLNSFGVFPTSPRILDLSELDGSAIPYRFSFSVALQYMVSKVKAIDYYDTFTEPTVVTNA